MSNQTKNTNGYKDKYIFDKLDAFHQELVEVRKSIKVINDHSGETAQELVRLQETIKPIQKIVYGAVAIILVAVLGAMVALVIIQSQPTPVT